MKKNINQEHFEGRVYQHDLTLKESGPQSKNPGTVYISGNLEIAVDEEGLNIIPIHFTYVTETYAKSGKTNNTFTELKRIIETGKTWIADGKDLATKVKVDASISLNDFYNQEDNLVSTKVNEGSFITIVNELCPENERNTFSVDMVITGVTRVEANEEKHIDTDYVVLKGAIFNYLNALLPVEFTIRNELGMKYFEDLEISSSEPMYTKVWGKVNCMTSTTTSVEESAFGEAAVKTYEKKSKSWDVTGTAKVPYDFGDEKVMTAEELTTASQNRQIHLADIKKKAEDYRAQKVSGKTISALTGTTPGIKTGEFHF